VFPARPDKDLNALIARLCVLFEDLRIEIAGSSEGDLGGLDECGRAARGLYFLRRSIATLYEFTLALGELDQTPSFQPIKAGFDAVSAKQWASAIAYFRKHERYIARIRHHVGGHFGRQAAEMAVEGLLPDAVGALEVILTRNGGGAKLLFASEIAATGTLRHVRGDTHKAKARRMIRHAVVAYRKAARAVDCIIVNYLWEKFGR
jgi:hypothetical protein